MLPERERFFPVATARVVPLVVKAIRLFEVPELRELIDDVLALIGPYALRVIEIEKRL